MEIIPKQRIKELNPIWNVCCEYNQNAVYGYALTMLYFLYENKDD